MRFGPLPLDRAEGAMLAHAVTAGGRTWRKAHLLSAEDIAALRAAGVAEVIAASLDEGDLSENEAATRIAAALGRPGIEVKPASTGRVNLHARTGGVLLVDRAGVDALNAVDEAITLATLPAFAAVEPGQMVATVKIIPFAVAADLVGRAAAIARAAALIDLRPFRPFRVGLVQTVLPSVKPGVLDKTRAVTGQRLARSGSHIAAEARPPHEAAALGDAIGAMAAGNDAVLVFGASAVADAQDVVPQAIRRAGGVVERVGMPVDPGNLLVLGRLDGKPVIGVPGCARSPRPNGFDWVLDRLAAGVPVTGSDIAAMGVGGLLMEIESRPQPREPRRRRQVEVHAVLLAAGRSSRMGGPNKLLAAFDGVPLVRRVAGMLAASKLAGAVAVVGHQADLVSAALEGCGMRIALNPEFATGLAGSLKRGIAAVPASAAGALIALADMPRLTAADIDRLVDAFVASGGAAIVRATHAGKRGNPVILPRALFDAVAGLQGDVGARHIVETSGLPVIDVEIDEAASVDVDTPEALAQAGGIVTPHRAG